MIDATTINLGNYGRINVPMSNRAGKRLRLQPDAMNNGIISNPRIANRGAIKRRRLIRRQSNQIETGCSRLNRGPDNRRSHSHRLLNNARCLLLAELKRVPPNLRNEMPHRFDLNRKSRNRLPRPNNGPCLQQDGMKSARLNLSIAT
jgi:hypothetical protein